MTSRDDRLSPTDLLHLRLVAADTARDVGRWIASVRPTKIESKGSGLSPAAQVVTEVDREAERRILAALAPATKRFRLGCLTEEQADDGSRHQRSAFWCIDPLDGTLPFIEGGPGYSVSIGLVSREGTALVGAVYVPSTGHLYSAARNRGATKNDGPLETSSPAGHLSVFGDRSFQRETADDVAKALSLGSAEVRIGAGGVVNALSVIDCAPACYFKPPKATLGGGSLWDFAATSCIVQEAGGVATAFDGSPLGLNPRGTTFMNHSGVLFATSLDVATAIHRSAL